MTDFRFGDPLPEHPSSDLMASYLSGRIAPSERATLEAHLAECRTCRRQATSARRLLATYRSRRPLVWMAPVAAAAALALVVFAPRPETDVPGSEVLRARQQPGGAEGASALRIISPASGDTIDRAGIVFAWQSHPGKPLFRLTLSDGSGRELWSAESRDTALILPAGVSLDRGRTYFWYVDAVGADGRSLTTRTQRFATAP